MRRARWMALISLSACACAEPSAMITPPSDGIVFVAVFDAEVAQPARIDGPFDLALESLQLSFDPPERVILFVFDADRIRGARITADLDTKAQIALSFDGTDAECTRGTRLAEGRLSFPLSSFGEAFELIGDRFEVVEAEDFPILLDANLVAPESRAACAPARPLTPFGRSAQLLAGDITISDERFSASADSERYAEATLLDAVVSVDHDRVLALSQRFLFLFERGADFSNDPRHVRAAKDLYGGAYDPAEFHALIELEERGQVRYAVLSSAGLEPHQSRVDVFEVVADGLEPAATSTFAGTYEYLFTDGESVFLIDNGKGGPPEPVRVASSLGGPFEPVGSLGVQPETRPAPGPEQGLFWVQMSDQRVFRFDLLSGSSQPLENQPVTIAGGYDTRGFRFDPATQALWLTADASARLSGHLLLRYDLTTGVWSEVPVQLGPEVGSCGTRLDPCGDIVPASYLRDVVRGELGQLSLLKSCSVTLLLDPSEGCEATAVPQEGGLVEPNPANEWREVAFDGPRVLVVGAGGYLLELDASPP